MRNRILSQLAIAALIVGAGPAVLPAQKAAATPAPGAAGNDKPQSSVKPPAHEVLLAVTVRDKKGALVTSLNKGDFTLTEDGRPQMIQSLTRQSDLPYKVGLLVDTSRSVSYALDAEQQATSQFVDAVLPEQPRAKDPDEAFLIHFDREVELLEDFTPSREKLQKDIGELRSTRAWHDDGQGPETTGDDRDRPSSRGRNNTQLYDAIFLACDQLMKTQSGRKALVVFSDGIDRGSKDTMNDAVDAADRANVAVYTIYMKGHEQDENPSFPTNRRGGIGYPGGGYPGGYSGGGGGYPGGGGQRREPKPMVDGKKIMAEIARRTGGHAYESKKREDLDAIYKLIGEELHGQYLLAYTPDKPDNDGGFHKVELKANKGDLEVTTREGYYAPGGEEAK